MLGLRTTRFSLLSDAPSSNQMANSTSPPDQSQPANTIKQQNGISEGYSREGSPIASPTIETYGNGVQVSKRNTFRDSMMRTSSMMRTKFGFSSGVAFDGQRSVHEFLKALRNERFRYMPHDGSNWDRVLKWAEIIGGVVLQSHDMLQDFMLNSEDATRLICDSCLSLIQMGSKYIKVNLKVFGVFHKMVLAMSVFLRQQRNLKSTSEVRRELAHAYSVFAHLTLSVHQNYAITASGHQTINAEDFESRFGDRIAIFYRHLESISTSMWATEVSGSHSDILAIRGFLTPQDSVVRNIMSNQLYTEFQRAEFTCEWFSTHLKKFTRAKSNGDRVCLVTGGACSGKTVLSRWILEKLQESIDDDRYDVISYFVDTNVRYTTSSLSIVKSLLLQVLDRKVGHKSLLSKIQKAMQIASSGSTTSEVESALWTALDAALDNDRLIILIDGLDQISGARIGNPPVLETLDRITRNNSGVKAILLGRPVSANALKHCQQHVSIEQEDNSADIRLFVESFIHSRHQLHSLKEAERNTIIEKVFNSSKGSFLLADLILQPLRTEKSASSILKLLEKSPKNIDEAIDHLIVDLDASLPETKQVLSWILAAERPLALKEAKALLEIDLDRCAYGPRFTQVDKDIYRACGSLVTIQDGLVSLRHPSIRERLISTTSAKSAKVAIDLKEAHRELALRCMAYVKIHLRGDAEPQYAKLRTNEMRETFSKYDLFDYCGRYWLNHFRASSLFDATGKHNLSDSFKTCFSGSTLLALVEGSCVLRQYIAFEAEKLLSLAYSIRRALCGEYSTAAFQSLMFLVRISQELRSKHLSAYSYDAWKIGRHVCHGSVVLELAKTFIESTLTITATSHKELIVQKEHVLCYIIETLQHDHNETLVIFYMNMLAEIYVSKKENEKAVVLYRKIYSIRSQKLGYLHSETMEVYEVLIAHLRTLSEYETIMEITLEYHEYLERTLSITDERRINSTLSIIEIYEQRNELVRAEEILVRFWRQVSTESRTTRVTELKIDFALKYSEFLIRYSRKEESETILRCVWTEVQTLSEESRFESTMIKRTQTIAEYFSRLEIHTVARSIYTSLYSYYQKTEQYSSSEAITIATYMAETVTKSISSSSSTSTTTVLTKEETSTLLEIFESSMSSSTTTISSTTIKVCIALCSSYIKEQRYSEACELYIRVISRVWASVEIQETTIDIIEEYSVEIIELAMSLAYCRFEMLQIEIATTIYWNIFRSLICSGHHEHIFVLKTVKLIIAFYERIYRYDKVIEIYRELFVFMPICFGKSHAATIEILYAFGHIAFRMGLLQEAATAYFYIYSAFCTGHKCLHVEGVKAALLLCEIYELDERWHECFEVYGYLWRTFLSHGESYKLEVEIVHKIYTRYMFVMEHKRTSEYTYIRQVAIDYRETCKRVYGVHNEITIKATLHLAEICERREEHYEESISLYNEVIKYSKEIKTSTSFTKTITQTVNKKLAMIYTSKTTTISKAVELRRERFEEYRRTERCSTETLTSLRSLVVTQKQQSTTESITSATQTLRTSVLDIFSHETRSEKLIESAQSIAETYLECGFEQQASTLIQEMRTKVIEEVKVRASQSVTTQQKSYVFLASFQSSMSRSQSFSAVMAELRSEILMYESYYGATRTQKDYISVMKSGYRLYFHLEKSQRSAEVSRVENELLESFKKYLNLQHNVNHTVMQSFFRFCLEDIMNSNYERTVIDRATRRVREHAEHHRFHEAYDLAVLVDRFIHLNGGFRTEHTIRVGFDLAKYLAGIGTKRCGEAKFYPTMLDLSRALLQEALEGLDQVDMPLLELSDLLTDLVSLLSEQKKYADLERILHLLWASRQIHTSLPSPLVLWIGRCLIETHACLGNFPAAIHLAKDIRYNLTHVRGELDKTTLDFTILLSQLYTETKDFRKAATLHEEVLTLIGDGHGADQGFSTHDISAIATQHAELLKRAILRRGKFDKGTQPYQELFAHLDRRFGSEKAWTDKAPRTIEKWAPGTEKPDEMGCWKAPKRFGFGIEGEETDVVRKRREEMVRRRSSNWARRTVNGNGTNGVDEERNGEVVY